MFYHTNYESEFTELEHIKLYCMIFLSSGLLQVKHDAFIAVTRVWASRGRRNIL